VAEVRADGINLKQKEVCAIHECK